MPLPPVLTLEMTDDGPVRRQEAARLPDASARLPAGAYTTLRTYNGRGIVRFEAHLCRLEESAALQWPGATVDPQAARRLVGAALDRTRHPESRLRLTFAPPRLFVSVEAFVPLPGSRYADGVACVTLPGLHRDQPHVKDSRFIPVARRAYGELPDGIEEGLLVADDGSLLEGLSSNFFAVLDGVLCTEGERVLPGITRALVTEVAESQGYTIRHAVSRGELPRVGEALLTSVSREVLPIVKIDGDPVGDGGVGPHARAIMQGFAELIRGETEIFG